MAVKLPNGATVLIATALAAAKTVTSATNAAEAVLTSTGHGFTNGDYVVLKSGWGGLNGRVFKIDSVDTNSFKLKGFDTSDKEKYPAGGGVGEAVKVTSWQQITQITEFTTSGGEQQFANFGFLEEDFERQLPSTRSAASISIGIGYDPALPGFQAAAAASQKGTETPLRVNLKDGSVIVYNGYPSLNETPTLTRNEIMVSTLAYALSGQPNRY